MPESLLPFLHRVAAGVDLAGPDARDAMRVILRNEATDAQIAAFLVALHLKEETAAELAGFAAAIREAAIPVPFVPEPGEVVLDTCGTGGDGQNTFNVSTTVAFVAAGCGVKVAKHGNRGVSSASGSADLLECLGVPIAVSGEFAARALRQVGICFLFAPAFHPALKQAQAVRRELKMRTAFNLLGPLANPAPVGAQIVGTPSLASARRVAEALAALALPSGYVVHGDDGLDEITTTAGTTVFRVHAGRVESERVAPEDFGFARVLPEALRGGDPTHNAAITRSVLAGERGPAREVVVVNAAMALRAAGAAASIADAVRLAELSIDSGRAARKLAELRDFV